MNTCRTCKHWSFNQKYLQKWIDNKLTLEWPHLAMCRRYPPIGNYTLEDADHWPITKHNDTCGEFEEDERLLDLS